MRGAASTVSCYIHLTALQLHIWFYIDTSVFLALRLADLQVNAAP